MSSQSEKGLTHNHSLSMKASMFGPEWPTIPSYASSINSSLLDLSGCLFFLLCCRGLRFHLMCFLACLYSIVLIPFYDKL